jgi:hypothetical protein
MANTTVADPRRRNLAILAAAAALSIVLAVLGLWRQAAQMGPKYTPTEYFPGFAAHVRQAARIHVVSKKNGAFDVVFKPIKGWILPGKNDYPASFEQVNRTLVGLATMQTIEPKTARADWLHYIGLDDPAKGGDGTEITVSDDRGRVLASIITGRTGNAGAAGGATDLFVRHPGDAQSWLVRSQFVPDSDQSNWMDKNILDLDRSRIRSTTVDEPGGPSFELSRSKPTDANFTLVQLPPGRELASADAADGLATALSDLTFDDIRPVKDFDFSSAVRLVTKTFDGLSVTAAVVKSGDAYWAEFGAMPLVNKPEIGKEARTIGAHASGWAFKLPDYKGAQLTAPMESLLKPKGAKPAAASP